MNIKGALVVIIALIFCGFHSCSEDDDGGFFEKDNQENTIEIKVSSSEKGVPINLEGVEGAYLTINDFWETKYITKNWGVGFVGRCNDETVLIKGEIFVNGDLVQKIEAYSVLRMHYQIK